MAIRTLGIVVTNGGADGVALQAAAAIARRQDAHLDVLCLAIEPMPLEALAIDGMNPTLYETGRAEAQEQARALAAWARDQLPLGLRAGVEPRTVIDTGLADAAARHARFTDLAVAPRPYGPDRRISSRTVAEALLLRGGVPVLVVPDAPQDWSEPFGRICLAWDESDPAFRAARAALPFLKAARQVDIAIIDPPVQAHDSAPPGEALSIWLSRHGVEADIALLPRTEPRTADQLTRFARERGAEAIAMGAYGHSRLREAMLGGATRDMLATVPLPLLMAH